MFVQRQDQPAGRGRFLLALSLSTAIAVAAAAPLAFEAVQAESDGQVPPGGSEQPADDMTTTTSTQLTGPTIGSRNRGQPIGKIVPGDDADLLEPAAPTVGSKSVITTSTQATTTTVTTTTTESSTTTSSTSSTTTTPSTTTVPETSTSLPAGTDSSGAG